MFVLHPFRYIFKVSLHVFVSSLSSLPLRVFVLLDKTGECVLRRRFHSCEGSCAATTSSLEKIVRRRRKKGGGVLAYVKVVSEATAVPAGGPGEAVFVWVSVLSTTGSY